MAKKDVEMEMDEMIAGSGPRVYEFAFHLDPELPTEEVKATYSKIKGIIETGAAIVAEGEAIKVPLAYTISRQETAGRRDFDSAYFAWIAYECEAAKHEELINELKSETRIVRYLDIGTDKEVARHAAEMRELSLKMPESKEGEEGTVSDTELDAALEEVAV